jgi:peroxiredoxin (alkyl hydroperoxide reductase subunit C)
MWRKAGPSGLALLVLTVLISAQPSFSQVLGPCGTTAENDAAEEVTSSAPAAGEPVPDRIPLPGERATNFELQAVVGDEIRMVKLSDFNGKWRILCFYPADFTFV